MKIFEGGYVPLLLAAAVYTLMYVWHRGADAVTARIHESLVPLDTFMAKLEQDRIPRVPGTAVFLTRATRDTPPVLVWHVRHNRALQQHVLAVTTITEPVPWIADEMRVTVTQAAPNFWRAIAHYGFMERPDIPRLLAQLEEYGCTIDLADVTYFVGHETVTPREDGRGPAALAGSTVCRDGAQRRPCDRLLQPARRAGRRDRPPYRDLRCGRGAWPPPR